MWHVRWLKIFYIFLVFGVAGTAANSFVRLRSAFGIENSSGPATAEGAEVLWQEAQDAYQHARYAESLSPIERLLSRYPGYPNATAYHELQAWLGRARLALGNADQAIPALNSYIENAGKTHPMQAAQARAWLAEAYIKLDRYREAILATHDLENASGVPLSPDLQATALLLRAQALIGLHRLPEASTAVASAIAPATLSGNPAVLGQARYLETQLKTLDCARFPSAKELKEDQTLDQLGRRGICLEESIAIFEKVIGSGSDEYAKRGQLMVSRAFHDYEAVCENPPAPIFRDHRAQYKKELIAKLVPDCRAHAIAAGNTLRAWKTSAPLGAASVAVQSLENDLREMAGQSAPQTLFKVFKSFFGKPIEPPFPRKVQT